MVWLAREQWSTETVYYFVLCFGSLGHHLPGLLRAYGDPQVFQRFKKRLILTPIFLFVVCTYFATNQLSAVQLVLYVWALWHAIMQTYGLGRIYDRKIGRFDKITSYLDFCLCFIGFGAVFFASPDRTAQLLKDFYTCGGPEIPSSWIQANVVAWRLACGIVLIAFVANLIRCRHHKIPNSPIKNVLFLSTITFWWLACVGLGDMILGVVMFEIFHNAQDNAIIWVFNRHRAEGAKVGGFIGFLFRKKPSMLALYIVLILLYGGLGYAPVFISVEVLRPWFIGMFATSAALHYYYEGFIWKVRDPENQAPLALLANEAPFVSSAKSVWPHIKPVLNWAWFAIPILWLGVGELRIRTDESNHVDELNLSMALGRPAHARGAFEHWQAVVRSVDNAPTARFALGREHHLSGRYAEAIDQYKAAIQHKPEYFEAYLNEAAAYMASERTSANVNHAITLLEKAVSIDEKSASAHNNLGLALSWSGEVSASIKHLERAVLAAPENALFHGNLADSYRVAHRRDKAIYHYRQALRFERDQRYAQEYKGRIRALENTSLP